MASRRLSLVALAAVLGVAIALWLSAGVLAIVTSGAETLRIGLLPSPAWLALLLIGGLLIGLVIRPSSQHAALALVSSLILLPWIPTPVPDAALVWGGHLRLWLWTGIAVALAVPLAERLAPTAALRIVRDPRRAPWLAAAVAACAYLAGAWHSFPRLPSGDEPHYLVITQSLLTDHDLKIENNHRRGDYHAYYGGELKPDYLRRGRDREIYSIHAPGLPAVIAPIFALFGYPGVVACLALASACATALAWDTAWRVTRDVAASWFGWATVALSVPFFFQSFVAFPDGLAAAIVMLGVATMIAGAGASERGLVAAGTALALLPWLHTRFALLAAALGILIVARNLHSPSVRRRATALLAVPAVSATGWFWFFYAVYGTPNPTAPYHGYTQSSLSNLARGVPGLLFDQQFGVIPNAPVYVCAGLGFLAMARRIPRLTIELLLLMLPYGLASAAYYMWWAGESSPARFLVSVLLPLAIPSACWFAASGRGARIAGLGALTLSLLITATLAAVQHGALVVNFRNGFARWLVWLSPLVSLPAGVPSLFQSTPTHFLGHVAVWAIAIVATGWIAGIAGRRAVAASTVAAVIAMAAALSGMTALSIVWRVKGAQPPTPTASQLELLRRYDPSLDPIAVRYSPLTRIPIGEVVPMLAVPQSSLGPDLVKRYGSAVVGLLDGEAYMEPEGVWIAGRSRAKFIVDLDGDLPTRLFVRNAPALNTVTVSTGTWHQEIILAPREERLIDLPIAGERTLLTVKSAAGARPADVDPISHDRRLLGAWIEIR